MSAIRKLIRIRFLRFGITLCLLPACAVRHKENLALLDRHVTMKVYSAEILESVINRLCVDTMQDIKFNTMMLLPYRAKARDYQGVTVRDILNDQLNGTPIKYKLLKQDLILYNAETGDYNTNRLTVLKR